MKKKKEYLEHADGAWREAERLPLQHLLGKKAHNRLSPVKPQEVIGL